MRVSCPRIRGYVLMPALLAFGVAGLYAVVLAKYALLDVTAVRREALEACAEQIAQSARAWAAAHAEQLGAPRELPISELLPRGASGRVLVERGTDGNGNPLSQTCGKDERAPPYS